MVYIGPDYDPNEWIKRAFGGLGEGISKSLEMQMLKKDKEIEDRQRLEEELARAGYTPMESGPGKTYSKYSHVLDIPMRGKFVKDLSPGELESKEMQSKSEQADLDYRLQQIEDLKRKPIKEESYEDKTEAKEMAKARVKAKVELAKMKPIVDSAISNIERVIELNKDSYGGLAGAAKMKIGSALNIGSKDIKFKNTADVINTMQSEVAKILKSTFGGQLSDSERQYLNQVYGAIPNMSQVEREIAMSNVVSMMNSKKEGLQETAGMLGASEEKTPDKAPKVGEYFNGQKIIGIKRIK